ncbi:MAG TPA: dUTP diphosphatase [Oligoflexia bacterium]|nr:dUTP diphosphatase [Oligoflexia bacterium]
MAEVVLRYYRNGQAKRAGAVLGVPREMDAGFDLPCVEDVSIPAHGFSLIATGLHLAIPEQWVGLVRDRSSVALRGGAVTAGVIDAAYRGEVKIAMHNLSGETLCFKAGERIAQLIVVPHLPGSASEETGSLEQLGESGRGHGGFGSTGR